MITGHWKQIKMRCSSSSSYGLIIPGSDSRFFSVKTLDPFPPYPTRVSVGAIKVKAKINDAAAFIGQSAQSSFYELLGISESGTLPEIKQAYKQLVRKYHPDVCPPDQVEEHTKRFLRVQEAYETLSDPRRRALYDRDLSKGLHLAFSVRRRYQNEVDMEEKSEWKDRWQSQLSELKRRSMNKDARCGNMSWAARMRRQRDGLSEEL